MEVVFILSSKFDLLPLKECTDILTGYAFKSKDFIEEGIPVIKIGTVNKGFFDTSTFSYLPSTFLNEYEDYILSPGDLLISLTGTTGKEDYGNVCIVEGDYEKYFLNQRVAKILVDPSVLDLGYLYHVLKHPHIKLELIKSNRGIRQANISKNDIFKLKIPVPPLETQKKIVEILEKAEKLKEWRDEADELADELLKGVFLDVFGDPVNNKEGWTKTNLENITTKEKFSIVDGPFGSSLKKEEYVNEGIPVIRINNIRPGRFFNDDFKYITEDKYNELIRSKIEKNDILIARVGNTIGKSCIFDQDYKALLSTTGVCKITCDPKKINFIFLMHQMNTNSFQKYILSKIEGAGQPYLNLTKIKSFQVILPPIKLQNQFAEIVKQVETLKTHQKQSKQQIDNLFNALMQKAFKGELTC